MPRGGGGEDGWKRCVEVRVDELDDELVDGGRADVCAYESTLSFVLLWKTCCCA